jgi:hypothetical protein
MSWTDFSIAAHFGEGYPISLVPSFPHRIQTYQKLQHLCLYQQNRVKKEEKPASQKLYFLWV